MAFATVRITPGVKQLQTPTLLQANIIASNLIRWRGGLPEKIGGWLQFYAFPISKIVRNLWAWADLSSVDHLATGGDDGVYVITNGAVTDISPQYIITNNVPDFSTGMSSTATLVSNSTTLTVTAMAAGNVIPYAIGMVLTDATTSGNLDAGTTIVAFISGTGGVGTYTKSSGALASATGDTITGMNIANGSTLVSVVDPSYNPTINAGVFIEVHAAVGGLTIYGGYQIVSIVNSTTYIINAGGMATGTVVAGGTVATYTTVASSYIVTVVFPAHGLSVGSTWPMPVPTTVGGLTLQGFYTVLTVIDVNTFTIGSDNLAPSGATVSDNGGNVQITYYDVATPRPIGYGWGLGGGWGSAGGWGGTGTVPGPVGTKIIPVCWTFGNFGGTLIINPKNGPLFTWEPNSGFPGSVPIPQAPVVGTGFFIAMPQQQIVVFGAAVLGIQDPMLVAWCDNANYNVWTASVSNQAGTYRLTRGSRIVGGIQGPQSAMLWTDVGMWLMQYIGYPDVYGFFEIAQGCGLIDQNGVAVQKGNVYWIGTDGFWIYAGGGVQRLPCDVWDEIFPTNLDLQYVGRVRAAPNTPFDEVAWYYPSAAALASGSNENDSYVKFNTLTGEWDYGSLGVIAWIDANVFGTPISAMIDGNGNGLIMQHETSPDANGQPIVYSYQTGFFMLSDGEDKVFVDQVIPDFTWRRRNQSVTASAQINLTLYSQDYPDDPNQPAVAYGPYPVTNGTGAIEVRVRGRYFSALIEGQDLGSFSRLGAIKFRYAPDGRN